MGITKKTNNNKHKGNNFERYAASKLSHIFGLRLARVYSSGAMDIKGDLRPEMDVHGNIPNFEWVIECKNQKTYNIKSWIKQMMDEEKANNKYGLLIFHVHGFKRNIVGLRTEVAEKFLYPEVVDENMYRWTSKPIGVKGFSKLVNILAYSYDYFGKELVFDIEVNKTGVLFMNVESFAKLFRKDFKRDLL